MGMPSTSGVMPTGVAFTRMVAGQSLQGLQGDGLGPQIPDQGRGPGLVHVRQANPAPGLNNAEGDGPGGAPGPQDEDVPPLEADFGRERRHRPQPVGVVAGEPPVPVDHGVHRPDPGGLGVQFIDQGDDFFFEGDGDAHPADPQTPEAGHGLGAGRSPGRPRRPR